MQPVTRQLWVKLKVSKTPHRAHPTAPWLDAKYQPCEMDKAAKFQSEKEDIYPISLIDYKYHA